MKPLQKSKFPYSVLLVFAVFFVVLLIEQSFVYPYLDDLGYASLSYINITPGVHGTDFSFSQFIDYYSLHYQNVTGRIIWQPLSTLILHNIWLARVMQSLMITLLMAVITYLISKNSKTKPYLIAVLVCCLYGFIEIFVIDKGIFWFSAAVLYIWPFILLLPAGYTYWRDVYEGRKTGRGKAALLCAVFFLTATAQEQVAAAQLVLLACITIYRAVKTKRIALLDALFIASSIGGLLFVALSPASAYKMALLKQEPSYADFGALPVLQKIRTSIPMLFQYLFSKNFYLLTLAMLGSGAYASFSLLKTKKGLKALNIAAVVIFILGMTLMLAKNTGLYQWALQSGVSITLCNAACAILILLLLYCFAAYYSANKKHFLFFAHLAAWASICVIFVVYTPTMGRLYIPFAILSILMMGDIFAQIKTHITKRPLVAVLFALIVLVSASNMYNYMQIYYQDSRAQIKNDIHLRAASQEIKQGKDIKTIQLEHYPNIESDTWRPGVGRKQVYEDVRITHEIKAYYDIPQSVEITWE